MSCSVESVWEKQAVSTDAESADHVSMCQKTLFLSGFPEQAVSQIVLNS